MSEEGGIGPVIPVIDVALVHADAMKKRATEDRRRIDRYSGMWFPCSVIQIVRNDDEVAHPQNSLQPRVQILQ